ncbi:MAG TPA: ATP-binding protein [Terriglobales bacterium]|nr:ATP-binding protein [Terriglobales bacterium]
MGENRRYRFDWLDFVWVLFLVGLAISPPVREIQKQLTLVAIGVVQILERRIVAGLPRRGPFFVVLLKLLLSTLLIAHTGGPGINSSYYPIYYLPIVTAAVYFDAWATLLWTTLAAGLYCSFLLPALEQYELTAAGVTELAIRTLFFFLAALIVNRFAVENRRQTRQYQRLAEQLAQTNRQLQQAQEEARRSERLAALGQLSAGLAHEIRNPLGVIKGSAEILSEKLEKADPVSSELAGYINAEVNRLSTLISRFLDFARPLHAETQPLSITELLDRALREVAAHRQNSQVEVSREYEKDLPQVLLDEDLAGRAFVNLMENAYDAMGDKGGKLRVEVSRSLVGSRGGVQVRLEDTGPGIPPELREQIFNPFVTTKTTGVGLGLSIVSKIVDEHRGSIRLETAHGGASFVLFFPVEALSKSEGVTAGT